ncbi:MAG: DNA repair protein RadA, partial [Lachnospiraceae bacterium]|nr:DNA repair protein RadA [Lachnospiraceae bacterium]
KQTSVYFCQSCGYESAKWMGQCPGCHEWNTFVEEPVVKADPGSASFRISSAAKGGGAGKGVTGITSLNDVSLSEGKRDSSGIAELDRVLGGGVMKGSLTLIGGDPGIGKSTLLLQVCRNMSDAGLKVLYVSGEESKAQIRMRADRIGKFSGEMKLLCETDLDVVSEAVRSDKPDICVIDSIQTMYSTEVSSAPGSVSQVRESTQILMQLAKVLGISIFIVGHVTKEGTVAGPRVLEHMVDTVLYFEGDRHASYRILRGVKNRFGSTNEIGVFEMRSEGLMEVTNPSEYLLDGRPVDASGSVVSCSMEGTRPILIEIQSLVCRSNLGVPRRQASGIDYNRVNLLMAVLEKRCGLHLGDCDAYVNLTGGMKLSEPALDLAMVLAIVSSFKNVCIPPDVVAFGEVGLSGEVRTVSQVSQRVSEAVRLGFKTIIVPASVLAEAKKAGGKDTEIIGVSNVREASDKVM